MPQCNVRELSTYRTYIHKVVQLLGFVLPNIFCILHEALEVVLWRARPRADVSLWQ